MMKSPQRADKEPEKLAAARATEGDTILDTQFLRTIVEQNWNHIRHLETTRLWTTNTYAFLIAAVLAFASGSDKVLRVFLLFTLFIIGILGFLMNLRIKGDVEDHSDKIRAALERVGLQCYMGFGVARGWISRIAIPWMFLSFYLAMMILFLLLLLHELGVILWLHMFIK